jgi:hypothetical protein
MAGESTFGLRRLTIITGPASFRTIPSLLTRRHGLALG